MSEASKKDKVVVMIPEDSQNVLNTYGNLVYRLALSLCKNTADAEDVFQDVFLLYMQNRHKLVSMEHVRYWLIRVTRNRCINLFRSSARKSQVELFENIPYQENPEAGEVYSALRTLPQKYRVLLHLSYSEGYSIRELAQIFHLPEGTVKWRLSRGRDLLREILEKEYDYELSR